MRILSSLLFAALVATSPAPAQQKDFLTPDEVEQVREIQEPDARLALYVKFAQQRVSLLDQLFAKQKTGRSGLIHQTLEQYTSIIEAIDTYVENALSKKKQLASLTSVAKAERELLKKLEEFSALEATDRGRYQFALEQAIDTTRDSADLSEEDLARRSEEVQAKETQLKKERTEMMSTERADELKKDQTRATAEKEGTTNGKKRPSLLKPGEKIGEQTPAPPAKKQ